MGAADVGEPLGHALRIVVLLVEHQDGNAGGPGFVRVTVGGDVEAATAGGVHQGHNFGRLTPYGDAGELEV